MPGKFHGQRNLVGYRVAKSQTQLNIHTYGIYPHTIFKILFYWQCTCSFREHDAFGKILESCSFSSFLCCALEMAIFLYMIRDYVSGDQTNYFLLFICTMHLENIWVGINNDKIFLGLMKDSLREKEACATFQLILSRF